MTDKTMTPGELADELERHADTCRDGAKNPRAEGVAALLFSERAMALSDAANLIRTTPLETEGERKLREALEMIAAGHGCPSAIARAALGDS